MDTPFCEIIGCQNRAQWFLISERDGAPYEQYLCHPHWRQMLADKSHKIIRWVPVTPSDAPAEVPTEATPTPSEETVNTKI
jgi:hypothetical protein